MLTLFIKSPPFERKKERERHTWWSGHLPDFGKFYIFLTCRSQEKVNILGFLSLAESARLPCMERTKFKTTVYHNVGRWKMCMHMKHNSSLTVSVVWLSLRLVTKSSDSYCPRLQVFALSVLFYISPPPFAPPIHPLFWYTGCDTFFYPPFYSPIRATIFNPPPILVHITHLQRWCP